MIIELDPIAKENEGKGRLKRLTRMLKEALTTTLALRSSIRRPSAASHVER
jgi:hypothetical protein